MKHTRPSMSFEKTDVPHDYIRLSKWFYQPFIYGQWRPFIKMEHDDARFMWIV